MIKMKAAIDLYDLYCVVYLRLSRVVTDFKNLDVRPTLTTRIYTIHSKTQIHGDPKSAIQTRSKVNKNSEAHALILVDLPFGKKAVRTKWVYNNKKDDRVYQMDVKSAFLYGTIDEEVYVAQPPGFVDPKFLNKVFKVVKALYMKSWCDKFEELIKNRFQINFIGELTFLLGLQFKQKEDGIFISRDKYVAKILKKFDFLSMKTASTPIETQKPLVKDKEAADVDVHLYREKTLRFGSCVLVPAFWFLRFVSCDLVLRFGPAFCLKTSCVLPKRQVAFCYKARCVLLQSSLRFASKLVVFCFKAHCVLLQSSLRFASKLVAICFKTRCVLLQDILCFVSRFLRFVSWLHCVLSTFEDLICVLVEGDRIRGCLRSFRQELLEYMGVHDNDASESSKPS
uniref:Retrotransposon protein, putative, unclassified n=1 Tax=Tanacetum cinerariifolium TaxID=118510 RepID=A0A6L2LRS6_TANCI|nr:retrotransposon protein, putative, unclassified [Tanacetum cinerariifolium]